MPLIGNKMIKSASRSILLIIALSLFAIAPASAADLHDFTSDGCSLFPDGNFKDRGLWCDCCLAHDISYWRGGTKEDRKHADETLRACVLERTGSKVLTDLIYDGVRAGGHPAFPTWYRWGYGWKYGKKYAPLTEQENQQVRAKLDAYYAKHPSGYCREKHGGAK
jgi:hypothetical protein